MSSTARLWFTLFAIVGVASGIVASALLWLTMTRPVLVAQVIAAWW